MQDPPTPESEPLPDSTHGPALPAPPIDDALLARQQAYLAALADKLPVWRSQGKTDAEIDALQAALKQEMEAE